MKQKKTGSSDGTDSGSGEVKRIAIEDIRLDPMFASLLPIDQSLQERTAQSMRVEGFFPTEPVTLGTWPGHEEPVLLDGHMRIRAALQAGITHVPYVLIHFENLLAAVQRAMILQTGRRPTTDGMLYVLCNISDELDERGGDRRSEEAKSMPQRCGIDKGRSASAKTTGKRIGCHFRTVEKIRKIRNHGTVEIQSAVRADKMRINTAYNLIRAMEKGEDSTDGNSSATLKAAKILISEENFANLKELGGDLGGHVNKALEMYIRSVKKKEAH